MELLWLINKTKKKNAITNKNYQQIRKKSKNKTSFYFIGGGGFGQLISPRMNSINILFRVKSLF